MSVTVSDRTDELIGRALQTEGGHLSIGRGGFTLYFDRGATLSGYDCEPIKANCIVRGLPVIDSREVAFDVVFRLAVRGPMIAVGRSPDPTPAPPIPQLLPCPPRASGRRAASVRLPRRASCGSGSGPSEYGGGGWRRV